MPVRSTVPSEIYETDHTLQHPPGGGQTVPPTGRLFELIWDTDREWMPILRELCDAQEGRGKNVVRLNSLDDLQAFTQSG